MGCVYEPERSISTTANPGSVWSPVPGVLTSFDRITIYEHPVKSTGPWGEYVNAKDVNPVVVTNPRIRDMVVLEISNRKGVVPSCDEKTSLLVTLCIETVISLPMALFKASTSVDGVYSPGSIVFWIVCVPMIYVTVLFEDVITGSVSGILASWIQSPTTFFMVLPKSTRYSFVCG